MNMKTAFFGRRILARFFRAAALPLALIFLFSLCSLVACSSGGAGKSTPASGSKTPASGGEDSTASLTASGGEDSTASLTASGGEASSVDSTPATPVETSPSPASETPGGEENDDLPSLIRTDGVIVCNSFRSVGEPPFSLPEAQRSDAKNGWLYYDDPDGDLIENYVKKLEDEGFTCVKGDFTTGHINYFCKKGDECALMLDKDDLTSRVELWWYAKSPFARGNTVKGGSAAIAFGKPIRDLAESFADAEKTDFLCAIDVTPEDFYERTGGQLFAVPVHLSGDQADYYTVSAIWFVRNHIGYPAGIQSVAAADLDGDGETEVCLLSYGPTSGLFSIEAAAVKRDGSVFASGYVLWKANTVGFAEKDGKAVLRGVNLVKDPHIIYDYAISLDENRVVFSGDGSSADDDSISEMHVLTEPLTETPAHDGQDFITELTATRIIWLGDSADTLHADLIADLLRKNGYIDLNFNGVHKDWTEDSSSDGFLNVTSDWVRSNAPYIELFTFRGNQTFLRIGEKVYRHDAFGGVYTAICLWDYNGDGVRDVVLRYFDGSGVSWDHLAVVDALTGKLLEICAYSPEVYGSSSAFDYGFTFDFDGENIYINGRKVVYREDQEPHFIWK